MKPQRGFSPRFCCVTPWLKDESRFTTLKGGGKGRSSEDAVEAPAKDGDELNAKQPANQLAHPNGQAVL